MPRIDIQCPFECFDPHLQIVCHEAEQIPRLGIIRIVLDDCAHQYRRPLLFTSADQAGRLPCDCPFCTSTILSNRWRLVPLFELLCNHGTECKNLLTLFTLALGCTPSRRNSIEQNESCCDEYETFDQYKQAVVMQSAQD